MSPGRCPGWKPAGDSDQKLAARSEGRLESRGGHVPPLSRPCYGSEPNKPVRTQGLQNKWGFENTLEHCLSFFHFLPFDTPRATGWAVCGSGAFARRWAALLAFAAHRALATNPPSEGYPPHSVLVDSRSQDTPTPTGAAPYTRR